jgi:hypothetical protein
VLRVDFPRLTQELPAIRTLCSEEMSGSFSATLERRFAICRGSDWRSRTIGDFASLDAAFAAS